MRVFAVKNDYCGGWQYVDTPQLAIEVIEAELENIDPEDIKNCTKHLDGAMQIFSMRPGMVKEFFNGFIKVKCERRKKSWIWNLPEFDGWC